MKQQLEVLGNEVRLINPYRFGGGVGGNDSYTKLLLHLDSDFTDSSASAHTVTAQADAQISSAQSKYGGASALFDGTLDRLEIADHADFEPSGAYTIDFWVYPNALSGLKCFVGKTPSSYMPYSIWHNGTALIFYASSNGSSWDIANARAMGTISTGSWYHVEIGWDGSNYYPFLNGTLGTGWANSSQPVNNAASLCIGARDTSGNFAASCYIDEFRFSNGICRHTSGFTPEGPYS